MGFRRIDRLDYNAIINGAYEFVQWSPNGATQSLSAPQYLAHDRWQVNRPSSAVGAGSINITNQADVPITNISSGYGSSARLSCAEVVTVPSSFHIYSQLIEGNYAAPLIGNKCVYRFFAKANQDHTYDISFTQRGANNRVLTEDFIVESGLQWKEYQFAIDFGESGIITPEVGVGNSVQVAFQLGQTGSATGVPIGVWSEVGSPFYGVGRDNFLDNLSNQLYFAYHCMRPVTDLEFNIVKNGGLITMGQSRTGNHYSGELALCQRYFEKSYRLNVRPGNPGDFQGAARLRATGANSSTTMFCPITFNTPKRLPTHVVTTYSPATGNAGVSYNDSNATEPASSATTQSEFQWSWRTTVSVTVNSLYSWQWICNAEI